MGYSPVYSAAFIQYTASTPNPLFEVPAGYTAVARYGSILQEIGGYAAGFFLADSEIDPEMYFDYASALGVFEFHQWNGRVVVPEGGFLGVSLSTVGDSPAVYLGGYLLKNVVS